MTVPSRSPRPARLTVALLGWIVLATCSDIAGPERKDWRPFPGDLVPSEACSEPSEVPLLAGQSIEVGMVTLANDETTLFVTFTTENGWTLASTALFVGESVSEIPMTPSGNPRVGYFPYKADHEGGLTTFTYAVPLPDADGELVVAAFADVANLDQEEGAWGAGQSIAPKGPWATWFGYTPAPCSGDVIGPDGGTIVFEDLELRIPPGALAEEVAITIERIDPPAGPLPGVFFLMDGTTFDLGPDGLEFLAPFEITITYDPAELPAFSSESGLVVFQMNAEVTALPGTVDPVAGTVSALGDHFSTFAIGGSADVDFTEVPCPDLSPAATSGIPMDYVPLGPFPQEFEPALIARIETDDWPSTFAIVPDEAGSAELLVPIHPSASPEGGPVRVRVTDGTLACPPFDFTIQPLPPAPGELGAIADLLQDILREQAALLDTTPEELVTTAPEDIPLDYLPLAVIQSALDDPRNESSFRAFVEGTAPGADGVRLDLLEPLLARTGLRQALEADALSARQAGAGSGVAAAAAPLAPASITTGLCTPDIVRNAGVLDHCMKLAASRQFELENASGEVLNKLTNTFTVARWLPGLGETSDIGGFALWITLNEKQRGAALLPSVLTSLTINPVPTVFLEDQAGPGNWGPATVTAANRGWDSGPELLTALFRAAKVVKAFEKLEKHVNIGGADIGDFKFSQNKIANHIISKALTGPVGKFLVEQAGEGELVIPPQTYGPISVSDEMWSTSKVLGDAVARTSHLEYEPREVGTATLSVRTADGKFGGQQLSEQAEITVKRIQMSITPDDVVLKPSEPQGFTVTVTDSKHPEMVEVYKEDELQGTAEIAHIADGLHIVSYTAPPNPDPAKPDLLTVRHTSKDGARAFSSEERVAIATIRFGRITITPREECLDVGEFLQFEAEVEGLTDPTVQWTASIGDIDENTGEYWANEMGTAIITATSVENPGVSDQVAIQVGGCTCSWSGSVDFPFEGMEGDFGEFQKIADGSAIENLTVARDDASASIVASFVTLGGPPLPIGSTGAFPIIVVGDLGGNSVLGYNSFSEEGTSVEATITQNDGEVLEGSLTGTVHFAEPFETGGRDQPFSLSFRITRDPLDSTDLVAHCTIGGVGAGQ